jgi:FdhD protein
VHRTEQILRFQDGQALGSRPDEIGIEEPLEIRVEGEVLAVAMRTPGADRELAAGWLLSEGIIRRADEITGIVARPGEDARASMVDVMLKNPAAFDAAKHRRAILSNASCGLCGAATVDQVLRQFPKIDSAFLISASLLPLLPPRLMESQAAFQRTGGLHACGLFDAHGSLLALREDVGRHNALDKLLGWALLDGRLPLGETVLVLSGRVSFEMMQKSLAAGIPLVAAIGAPSSLAVEMARNSSQTLVAFLRGGSFNVYAGEKRIRGAGV